MHDPAPPIRRATAADADAVSAITQAAYARWVPIIGRKPAPMLADYAVAVRTHIIDLIESAATPIALIELVPEPDCLLIENIAVLPTHAGHGHGTRLLAHAETVARAHGLTRLRLYTNQKMTSNIALYQRRGFAIDREAITPDGRAIVHMSQNLAIAPH